ncbi:MAG: 6-pyruvoyl-tetrahydropterin synthase-related protein, partial [Acidimicrobiales bacterium]
LPLPYNVAFKLVSVLGLVSLPVAAWAFGRLARVPAPGPACLAVAAVPFLFERGFTIYGGNIPSTLAGEFSFSISLSMAVVFLGVLARVLDTGRHRALAGVLLGLTLLSHVIPTFFAITAAVVMALLRPGVRAVARTVTVGVLAGLVGAFWALPFLARLPYTNDMGWEKIVKYRENLLPYNLRWLVALAGVGAVISLVRRCRTGTLLTVMALVAAAGFRFAPQGKIWNARLLPFWFLCLYLLAGLAAAWLVRGVALAARAGPARDSLRRWTTVVAPPAVLAATLTFVALPLQNLPSWMPFETEDSSFIPAWTAWNYSGYERKAAYPEYREIIDTMAGVGRREGCGRAMWEYEQELNELGTPLALMLLPYWTDGCIGSLEGLYYESSATTPFNFLVASELSKRPSRPQRNLPYRDLDLATGVPHLQTLGVRYYMALSADAKAAAAVHPDLRRVATTGAFPVNYPEGVRERSWEVYQVAGSSLVVPLENEPVVVSGVRGSEQEWLDTSVAWWQDAGRADVVLAEDGPSRWARGSPDDALPPRRAVPPVSVSRIRTGDGRISFDVDRPGSPVLVRASYFPNWKVSGADGPWRVTPNMMVVVPTGDHVELRYGHTPVDLAGFGFTGLGLAAAVVLWRRDRRRPADDAANRRASPDLFSPVVPQAPTTEQGSDEEGLPAAPVESARARTRLHLQGLRRAGGRPRRI